MTFKIRVLMLLSSAVGCLCGISAVAPAVVCADTHEEHNISSVMSNVLPGAALKFLDKTLPQRWKDAGRILSSLKVPVKHFFGVGSYNISIDPDSKFLHNEDYSIQFVVQHRTGLNWLCKELRKSDNYVGISTYDLLCRCDVGETIVGSTGDTHCVVHPCSSFDMQRGWCYIETDPLRASCIQSHALRINDVLYHVKFPDMLDICVGCDIRQHSTTLTMPLSLYQLVIMLALLLCPANVIVLMTASFTVVSAFTFAVSFDTQNWYALCYSALFLAYSVWCSNAGLVSENLWEIFESACHFTFNEFNLFWFVFA